MKSLSLGMQFILNLIIKGVSEETNTNDEIFFLI